MNPDDKARLFQEQILHRLGYNVFTIPKLTPIERKRLVDGYMLFESKGEWEDPEERQEKIDELITARKKKDGRT